jgi:hypothetical protein
MATDTAVETPQKSARWEDVVDVYVSPRELFERRANDSWGTPFLILCAVLIVLHYVFLSANSAVIEAAALQNAPPDSDLTQVRQGARIMSYFGAVAIPIFTGLIIAWTALAIRLASAVLEPGTSWRQSFLIATFAMFVAIPQQFVVALLVMLKDGTVRQADVSIGLLRFFSDADPILAPVLTRVDLFAFWSAVLCTIGLITIVRMPRGKAIATAAIAWIAVALPGVVSALLFGGKSQ